MDAQPQTKTFARLVTDYWARCAGNALPPQATALYFYILGCLSRTGWRPIRLADREVAEDSGVGRRRLSQYRAALIENGLLSVGESSRGSVYSLPDGVAPDPSEMWMEYAATCQSAPVSPEDGEDGKNEFGANMRQSGANVRQSPEDDENEFGANMRQSGANMRQSQNDDDGTHLLKNNINNNTTTSTTGAPAHVREGEKIQEEQPATKARDDPEAELAAARREAARRAPMILQAFFQDSQQIFIEGLCRNNGVSLDELRGIAQAIVADWVHDGKLHNDRDGLMDLREALRHLRYTVPMKKAVLDIERRRQSERADRDSRRSALMNDAVERMNRAMSAPQTPESPAPF